MAPLAEDDAPLYALGLLNPGERVLFEHLLCKNRALARQCDELIHLVASLTVVEATRSIRFPAERLRAALLEQVRAIRQQCLPVAVKNALCEAHFAIPSTCEAVVYSDKAGMIHWVNPAFTHLCGYTLAEVQGVRAGAFLRGPDSEPEAAAALNDALRNRAPALQRIVNYHKNGKAYQVEIDLRPVSRGFIALERAV